jgi:ABC-2 type transport system permease protein
MKKLIKKEVLDLLRDPRIILPFLLTPIIFLIIGAAISQSVQTTVTEMVEPSLIKANVIFEDMLPQDFTGYLKNLANKEKVEFYFTKKDKELNEILKETNYDVYVLIPKDFFEKIERKERGTIYTYSKTTEFSFVQVTPVKEIRVVRMIENYIKEKYVNSTETLNFVTNPIYHYSLVYLPSKDTIVSSRTLSSLFFGILIASVIILSLGAIVMQISSTSTAVENEYKTLEILLLLPISRFKILLAKLIGTYIVSLIGLSLFIVGFLGYFFMIASLPRTEQGVSGFTFSFAMFDSFSATLLIISIIISLFFMASLGVIIGILSNDVRLANTLTGPIFMVIFIPAFYLLFSTPPATVKGILMSIPYVQTLIFIKEIITTNFNTLHLIYIFNSLLVILILIFITSKIFSLEILLNLQNKISRRFKRRV